MGKEEQELTKSHFFFLSPPKKNPKKNQGRVPRRHPPPGPIHRLPGRVRAGDQPVLPGRVPPDRQAHLCRVRELRERESDGEGLVMFFFSFCFCFSHLFSPPPPRCCLISHCK